MIAFARYASNMPGGNPWIGVGPVYTGRGEWRRTVGVSISIGGHACAAYWDDRTAVGSPDRELQGTAALVALLGRLVGRRP